MKRLMKSRPMVPLPSRTGKRAPPAAPLQFSPYAWGKLVHFRDAGPTEIGGFGLTRPGRPLLVEDIRLVRQQCTVVTVEFDDQAVADYYDEQVDAGRTPAEFGRIWIHTHPGSSPLPSTTDEATFARCFGAADWAVMFILAASGRCYARLRVGDCPGGAVELPVQLDFSRPFAASHHAEWEREYADCVELSSAMFRSLDVRSALHSQGWDDALANWEPDRKAPVVDLPEWEAAYE